MSSRRARRLWQAAGLLLGLAIAGSCTTWNGLPLPSAPDGGGTPDGGTDVDAAPSYTSYLDVAEATALCSRVFQCGPALALTILESIGLVVDTGIITGQVANFSLCVDVLAGPVDPNRVGLATQRAMLTQMANATSCDEAVTAGFIYPVLDAGVSCPVDMCAGTPQQPTKCIAGTVYTTRCDSPPYLDSGVCKQLATPDGGTSTCNQTSGCTGIVSQCLNGTVVQDCDSTRNLDVEFDCAVQGRSCELNAGRTLARCTELCNNSLTPSWDCFNGSVRLCDLTVQSTYDCAAVARVCLTTPTPTNIPYCGASTDTCKPTDSSVNKCTGTSIALCVAGQVTNVDCSTLPGGQSCQGATPAETAHCGP